MEEAIISLIEWTPYIIIALGFFFYSPIASWVHNRNERLLREQKHSHTIKLLKAKQEHELALAEKTQDSIQMLALDPKFGEDFDRRLRIALTENKDTKTNPLELLEVSEDDLFIEEPKKSKRYAKVEDKPKRKK